MKKYYFYISLILLFLSSCTKDTVETIPTRNLDGDYFYTSNSTYYSSNNTIDREIISQGGIYVYSNSSISIEVYPNIGYSFTIEGSNLQNHGDTTTFTISMQQIIIYDEIFNLTGTNSVDLDSLGEFDGYFTNNKIVFAYKSYNAKNYEWVETKTEADKRN